MMKKVTILILVILPVIASAQITLNAQLPPAGLVQKDQLWNLILSNTRNEILEVNIKMILQDAVTGQTVMSANTGNLLLGKGIKVIKARDIQPILYNYNMPDFSRTYLPMGFYIACYQLYHTGPKGEEPLGDQCIKFTIDPLSPPLLNTPADESEIETPYPQFTWMPPTPFDMFNELSYEILVMEILPGQTAPEAVQYNTPLYTRSNLTRPYEYYPSTFEKLDTGKLYAWQVIAKNGLNYTAKTEIWKFRLKKDEKPKIPTYDNVYILMQDDLLGTYAISKGVLHVKYYSFNNEFTTQVLFKDIKGKVVYQEKQTIVPGDNYFDFKINNKFQLENIYQVSITDLNGKTHVLKFSIVKN